MSIRVGRVEIKATQRVEALEARTLVGMRVPGQAGGVQQNLGREPLRLAVEGLLYGSDAGDSIETLRNAYATGEPQSFSGDIAIGSDFTDVIVEDLRLVQVAGTRDRYQASLKLREYIEPPPKASFGLERVDLSILDELGDWLELAKLAVQIAMDPDSALDILKNNKFLKDQLGVDKWEEMAYQAAGNILGVSPDQVRKWKEDAVEFVGDAVDFAEAVAASPDLLPELQAVAERAARLVTRFTDGSFARALTGEGPGALDQVAKDLERLVDALQKLLANKALRPFVRSVAKTLGLESQWNQALEAVGEGLGLLSRETRALIPWVAQVDALLAALELMAPGIGGITRGAGHFTGQLKKLGAPIPAEDIAAPLGDVQKGLDIAAAYGKAVLPKPQTLDALAKALDPELRQQLNTYRVEA